MNSRSRWIEIVILIAIVVVCIATVLLMGSLTNELFLSILGGVIVAASFALVKNGIEECSYQLHRKTIVEFFGPDAYGDGLKLAYSSYVLRGDVVALLNNISICRPYLARGTQVDSELGEFMVPEAVAAHDIESISRVVDQFSKADAKYDVVNASVILEELDLSLILFGLGGNCKVLQFTEQLGRYGYRLAFKPESGMDVFCTISNEPLSANLSNHEMFGYVIRIRPRQFPNRTWILCGGNARDGTPMASCYLANNMKTINAIMADDGQPLGRRPCIVVLRGTSDSIESARVHAVKALADAGA